MPVVVGTVLWEKVNASQDTVLLGLKPAMFKKEILTTIDIETSADRVWQILTDFAAFPQWNPFIRRATGNLQVGAVLTICENAKALLQE